MDKHRKVQIVVLLKNDATQRVLLLQTKADRGQYWQFVTGSVDEGETWEQGAKRELLEETGISAEIIPTSYEIFFQDRWNRDVHEKVFYAFAPSEKVVISQEEHQDYKWIGLDQIGPYSLGHLSSYKAFEEVKKCLN